jgi:FkbM family methyltransferase
MNLSDCFLDTKVTVADIGAALTESPPYQSLIDKKLARVIGFEPNPEECDRLNKFHGPPHVFYPHFIGDGREHVFYETNWAPTGSLFKPNMELLEKFTSLAELTTLQRSYPVQTCRLDDVPEIGAIDYLKLDVQGAELMILQNAPRTLQGVSLIQVEVEFVELYQEQPMFSDVDAFLRNCGFQFHGFSGTGGRPFKPLKLPKTEEFLRQILWADALYVRDWMNLERVPLPQLERYALLTHELLNSFDLTLQLLFEIDRRTQGKKKDAYLARIKAEMRFVDHFHRQ